MGRKRSSRTHVAKRQGPYSGGRGHHRRRYEAREAEEEGRGVEFMRSALLFFLVYLGLRVVVSIFRHRYNQMNGAASVGAAVTPSAGLPPTGLDGVIPS